MPHLLNVWPSVSRLLRNADSVLLLLDYDGTLTPIVKQPDLAVLPADTRKSLLELLRQEKYIVGIISARSLEDIVSKVGIDELIYAGNHGLEMRGPGLSFVHPEATQLAGNVNRAYARLQQGVGEMAGVLIEHKGLTLTVHYRSTPEWLVHEVKQSVEAAVGPFVESGALMIAPGKKALEIRPDVSWDKGKAVSRLQEVFPQASLTLFFGDDLPDEAGFTAAQNSGGLGVFVGPAREPTVALYQVDSPREVEATLRLMAQLQE